MAVESPPILERVGGLHIGVWVERSLAGMGALLTVTEFWGMASQGLRFLGRFAGTPAALMTLVGLLALLVWGACGFVLLRRRQGAGRWYRRPAAYSRLARGIALALLIANLAVSLFLILGILRYDVVHAAPVQEGQFGIAVAQFGEGLDMEDSALARELNALVARSLRREIDLLPNLGKQVTIVSASLVRDEQEAKKVAEKMGARLVVWGWVSGAGGGVLAPSFTFAERTLSPGAMREMPPWYESEISGGSTLELSQMTAQRISGFVAYTLGLIYLSQGDYPAAIAEVQQAIALTQAGLAGKVMGVSEQRTLNRSLAIYHMMLGRIRAAQGDAGAARQEFETALRNDPEFGFPYIGLGNIEYSAGHCAQALASYDKAVQLAPAKARTWYSRGNAYFCLDDFARAAEDYEKATRLADETDESPVVYHLTLGISLCRLNRPSEGLQSLLHVQQFSAPDSDLYRAAADEMRDCRVATTPDTAASPTAIASGALDRAHVLFLNRLMKGAAWSQSADTPSLAPAPTRLFTVTPSAATTATVVASLTSTPKATPTPTQYSPAQPATSAPPQPLPTRTLPPTAAPVIAPPTNTQTPRPTDTRTRTRMPTAAPTNTPRPTATRTSFPTVASSPPPPTPTRTPFPTVAPSHVPFPSGTPAYQER